VKNQEVSCHNNWRTDQFLTHRKKVTEVDMMRQKKPQRSILSQRNIWVVRKK
jgi:hypothetical protein